MDRQLEQFVSQEIATINRCIGGDFAIDAGVTPASTVIVKYSHIHYGLIKGAGVKITQLRNLTNEVSLALSQRRRDSFLRVRFSAQPLGYEVAHPNPTTLHWPRSINMGTHSMLIGKSFDPMRKGNSREEMIHFKDQAHTLIAGKSGAGKSILLSGMLSTLCMNTSPEELRIILIDLKNEDMVPFGRLPHTEIFAYDMAGAIHAITKAEVLKQRRVTKNDKSYRLLVVIDELAELKDKEALEKLGSILSIGRTKGINIIAATQHPLSNVVGSIAKANFNERLVGKVQDANAATVSTGRKETEAHLLPGKGSFLRISPTDREDPVRFQSYFVPMSETDGIVDEICQKWPRVENKLVVNNNGTSGTPMEPLVTNDSQVIQIATNEDFVALYTMLRDDSQPSGVRVLAPLIREAFGKDTNTGGNPRRVTMKAIRYIQQTLSDYDANTTTTTATSEKVVEKPVYQAQMPDSSSSSSSVNVWM
jgi:S-DNA-T family DNA segregation ATPase FtsK/SpoIIIE